MKKYDVNQARALADNKSELIQVNNVFTDNEMLALKDELSRKMILLEKTQDEFKLIADEWKSKIKEQKGYNQSILDNIKLGYEILEKECYLMPDYDLEIMNYVDVVTGEVHSSRRLLPSENQMNLTSVIYKINEVQNG